MKTGKKILLKNVLEWTGAKNLSTAKSPMSPDFEIRAVSTDTRSIEKGDFFIPVKGQNYDGHDFIADAVSKGCCGFLFEDTSAKKTEEALSCLDNNIKEKLLVLKASSSISFLLDLSAGYIKSLKTEVIGITGSAGKTTAKEFAVSILSEEFPVSFTPQNYNTELGISKSVLAMDGKTKFFIAEMGMRGAGQIKRLSEVLNLKMGAITSIGASHLEFFNDISGIALAKAEIAEVIAANGGMIFLNIDDEWTGFIIKNIKVNYPGICIKTFGRDNASDYNFMEICSDKEEKYTFELFKKNKKITDIYMPISGYHNIYNACCAAAVCLEAGAAAAAVKTGIEKSLRQGSRMKVFTRNGKLIIDDCYNASPVSMKAAIDTLARISSARNSRSVAVVADMFELGTQSSKLHTDIGLYLAEKRIDVLVAYGRLSENICRSFEKSCHQNMPDKDKIQVYHFESMDSLCKQINIILKPEDTVLVKGSRANKLENVIDCI